jgi:hypothetical protein
MGFRMDDPDAASMFLFRRRIFNRRPVNDCDLAPIFYATNPQLDCSITTIGCNGGAVREENNIIQSPIDMVHCTAASCGNGDSSPFMYVLKVERKANRPGFNSLCDCGDAVDLFVYDEDGEYVKQIQGVVKDTSMGFPYARYFIETTVALTAGQCIKGIKCADPTNLQGFNVLDAWDIEGEDGHIGIILDSPITCGEGDTVIVRFYDANGVVLGSSAGEIESFNPNTLFYQISSNAMGFGANMFANQASIGVSCNEAPNVSSSSSSGD